MAIEPQDVDARRNTTDEASTRNEAYVKEIQDRLSAHSTDQASLKSKQQAEAKVEKTLTTYRAAHEKILDKLCSTLAHIEELTSLVRDGHTKLRSQRMRGFSALQVCNLRQKLREKLPPSETTFNDGLQEALEAEKKLLEDSREEMLDLGKEGENIAQELDFIRTQLSKAIGARRLHAGQFTSSLKSQCGAETSPRDATWESIHEDVVAENRMESERLIEETRHLFTRCEKFYHSCRNLINRVANEENIALNLVESEMRKRTADLALVRKKLEMEVLQTERAIVLAERNLERIARRVDRENQKGAARLEDDVQALEALRNSQTSLVKQARKTFAALQIENACIRVTPAKADGLKRRRARSLSNIRSTQQGKMSQSISALKQASRVGASGASPRSTCRCP